MLQKAFSPSPEPLEDGELVYVLLAWPLAFECAFSFICSSSSQPSWLYPAPVFGISNLQIISCVAVSHVLPEKHSNRLALLILV